MVGGDTHHIILIVPCTKAHGAFSAKAHGCYDISVGGCMANSGHVLVVDRPSSSLLQALVGFAGAVGNNKARIDSKALDVSHDTLGERLSQAHQYQ